MLAGQIKESKDLHIAWFTRQQKLWLSFWVLGMIVGWVRVPTSTERHDLYVSGFTGLQIPLVVSSAAGSLGLHIF